MPIFMNTVHLTMKTPLTPTPTRGEFTIVVGDELAPTETPSQLTLESHANELLVVFLKLGFFPVTLCYFGPNDSLHQHIARLNQCICEQKNMAVSALLKNQIEKENIKN